MAPKHAPKPEFQEGERVLCFYWPLLYEAKCLKVDAEAKQVRYLIHYSGWNKNWDEWVPESRVLKYSEANLQKQRELQRANQEHQAEGRARSGGRSGPGRWGAGASSLQQQQHMEKSRVAPSTSARATASTGRASGLKSRKSQQKTGGGDGPGTNAPLEALQPPGRRARGDPASQSGAAAPTHAELLLQIPAELKRLLVQDWELVTKQGRLFALPAAKSVDAILAEYVAFQWVRGRRDSARCAADELVGVIRSYFNGLLGTQLLYEAERPQHGRVLAAHPEAPMSQLYGGPHLLRLFVRIRDLLAHTPFDDCTKCLALHFDNLRDFLCFLARDPATFFNAAEYKEASQQKAA